MFFQLPTRRSLVRTAVERGVLLLIVAMIVRTWYLEGWFVPCRVTGGSMAPTLLGTHRDVTCSDCGLPFACGSYLAPVKPWAVCPNCGASENDLQTLPDLAGDRLLIHKSVFHLRSPRRWELVAFRRRSVEGVYIKRVVGLPGEKVQIIGGDVYADGRICRKPLPLQRAMAILVHDANFQGAVAAEETLRWRAKEPDSRWGAAEGRFAHPGAEQPNQPTDQTIDWLEYRHLRPGPAGAENGPAGLQEGPITDLDGYNQTRPRRDEDVHPVDDLLLSFRFKVPSGKKPPDQSKGRLAIRAGRGANRCLVYLDPNTHRWELWRTGQKEPIESGPMPPWTDALKVELSLFDRQILLVLDGKTVARQPLGQPPEEADFRSLAIGSDGLRVTIEDVRIHRDVYYTHPIGLRGRWAIREACRMAEGEYFVLGDNSPISEDSRSWAEGPGVSSELLLGKPLIVHFPARSVRWGRWEFQVPELAKIRYIR